MEKKIIMEQNGKSDEISQSKLDEISQNPNYQVDVVEDSTDTKKVNVKSRLYD